MKSVQRDEIQVDIIDFQKEKCICVCEWYNGEGTDISISCNHIIQTYSFTYDEWDAINAVIQFMRSGIKEDK